MKKRNLSIRCCFISLSMSTLLSLNPSITLPVYAWSSNPDSTLDSTHPFIVSQSLHILLHDLSEEDRNNPEFMHVINQFESNIHELRRGSVAPDYWDQNYKLFQDHFYDPYTQKNFSSLNDSISTAVLDYIHPTAMTRSKEYTGWALQQWKMGNPKEAIYQFGKAMHYYSDLCEPHHASNAISSIHELITKHTAFETFTDSIKENSQLTTLGDTTASPVYTDTLSLRYYSDFLVSEGDHVSKTAQSVYKEQFHPHNKSTWEPSANITLKNNQKSITLLMYRFAKEITNPNSESTHATATHLTLNVRVQTTSGSLFDYYGTDNSVFFGVELKNGRYIEWLLDKPGYNDHEAGDNDTYIVTLEKSAGADIKKAWIRKQHGWEAASAEDNWHLQEVEVSSNDSQLQFLTPVRNWLIGNVDITVFGE